MSYSLPPNYDALTFIGVIANARPSDTFHPGFALNPEVNVLSEIKLVVQLKPLDDVKETALLSA